MKLGSKQIVSNIIYNVDLTDADLLILLEALSDDAHPNGAKQTLYDMLYGAAQQPAKVASW